MKFFATLFVLAVAEYFVATASAQHHGGHHGGHYAPAHHGSYYGHSNWHHVVPHHQQYAGAYYSVGAAHYYTPSPVVAMAPPSTVTPNALPPTVVQVQRPVQLEFGGFSRYEDLAGRLVSSANALCLELHYNYRENSKFDELYGEAYDVLQAAKFLRGMGGNGKREEIVKQVVAVDKLFHHVKEEVPNWTRNVTKRIDDTELPTKLERVEALVHHLAFDVGVEPHSAATEEAPPPQAVEEIAPPPANRK